MIIRQVVPMNLQYFAGEKTEKATTKKKQDARKKGQVVTSKDLTSVSGLLAVVVAINALGGYISSQIAGVFNWIMSLSANPKALEESQFIMSIMGEIFIQILTISIPLLGVALLVGFSITFLQVGPLFSTEAIQPKLDKINPISGFKRMFSIRSLVELVKSLSKAGLLIYVAITYVISRMDALIKSMQLELGQIFSLLWDIGFNILIRCIAVLFVLAIGDYAYKYWQNERDLRMSKQEIKDEYKMVEGDPQLKGKIKEKQRQMAMGRMMQEVPGADVVITNPTHFAVAITYDADLGSSPKVVAKGQDLIAANIKRIAGDHDVPVIENKPLARALYADVEIGDFIPEVLYHAVAEVLAYVYNLKKKV